MNTIAKKNAAALRNHKTTNKTFDSVLSKSAFSQPLNHATEPRLSAVPSNHVARKIIPAPIKM